VIVTGYSPRPAWCLRRAAAAAPTLSLDSPMR